MDLILLASCTLWKMKQNGGRKIMPSTYAHYRFGKAVYRALPKSIREIIRENKSLYLAGLHGPDILFYYKALFPNRINKIGFDMHGRKASEFFAASLGDLSEEQKAYIFGFICHFALDSACHGYIDEKIASSKVTHTEIEVEFDRMLMIKDGYDPVRHRLTGHILADIENSRVISSFFEGVTAKEVRRALRSMKFYNNLLIAPFMTQRCVVYFLLLATGNYKEMHGLLVNRKANPKCTDSNQELYRRYREAVGLAVELIENYCGVLDGTQEALLPYYHHTFGAQ